MEKSPTLVISSPKIKYTDDYIYSDYEYEETLVTKNGDDLTVRILQVFYVVITFRGICHLQYRSVVYVPEGKGCL